MNHPFLPSQINPKSCARCSRNYISHTQHATCEACSKVSICELFGAPSDSKSLLLCSECHKKEMDTNNRLLTETEPIRSAEQEVSSTMHTLETIKQIDQTIRFNGDFFNSKIVAIEEMRAVINSDNTIPDSEKSFKFQNALMERFTHLKDHIFELDSEKHRDVTEQLVIRRTLNDLGNDLRKEIREKIKEADSTYIPGPVAKPKVKATVASKTPEERVIEALALARGITKEAAAKLLAITK